MRNAVTMIDPWSSLSFLGYTVFAVTIFGGLVLELLLWIVSLVLYMIRRIFGSASSDFTGEKSSKLHEVLLGHSVWKVHLM